MPGKSIVDWLITCPQLLSYSVDWLTDWLIVVRRSRMLIGAAWFFSFIFSTPMLFLYEQDRIEGYLQCWISFPSQVHWQIYFTLVSITLFLVPVLIIIGCFAVVLRTIWVRGKNLEFEESMTLSRQDSFDGPSRVGSVLYRSKRLAAGKKWPSQWRHLTEYD